MWVSGMGLCKVVRLENGRGVRLVHQLDQDGNAYAEDITVEVQEGVDPSRLSDLMAKDGKIGICSWYFSEDPVDPGSVTFPGA